MKSDTDQAMTGECIAMVVAAKRCLLDALFTSRAELTHLDSVRSSTGTAAVAGQMQHRRTQQQ